METLMMAPTQELKMSGNPPLALEGLSTTWMIADFNDVVLHVFDDATRAYYDIEELWKAATRVELAQKSSFLTSVAL